MTENVIGEYGPLHLIKFQVYWETIPHRKVLN